MIDLLLLAGRCICLASFGGAEIDCFAVDHGLSDSTYDSLGFEH